jgi:pimeloyl-ACP methyl ester carboxylesterase
MTTLRTKAGAVAYTAQGDGPPVVLLRGLGRTVKHWLGYERKLAESLKVITLALRGIGTSPAAS